LKLIRFGEKGSEKPGVCLNDNRYVDASGFGEDFNEDFFGTDGLFRLKRWLKQNEGKLSEVNRQSRLGAPLCRPSKLICIGLNFADHARESGANLPEEPVIFFKATSAICGPYDDLQIPKNSSKTDWEVELTVVISKEVKYVDEKEALNHVAGYLLHNDYSEREFQLEKGGQWVKGKSADTFAPLGPYLVTPDEIQDVDNLNMWLKVNGEYKQQSNTKNLIFKIPMGLGMDPPQYLKAGDVVELGIDGLGESKQQVVAYTP
jgi:2-keto-4-pentenoate hydratase/2-oxohepta-3-ene-1,7-dioic acid hydratase in catechol pathway